MAGPAVPRAIGSSGVSATITGVERTGGASMVGGVTSFTGGSEASGGLEDSGAAGSIATLSAAAGSLLTNFGKTSRTTTADAGRRSITSRVSWPMRSKASRPALFTSSGNSSISTRGRCSGNGFRTAFLRVCAATSSSSSSAGESLGASFSGDSASRPSAKRSIARVSCWSLDGSLSAFWPRSPRFNFSTAS